VSITKSLLEQVKASAAILDLHYSCIATKAHYKLNYCQKMDTLQFQHAFYGLFSSTIGKKYLTIAKNCLINFLLSSYRQLGAIFMSLKKDMIGYNEGAQVDRLPDLTSILVALEVVDNIPDPVGRYQGLYAIAAGFGMDYAQLNHLYALYCSEA
jgi:hypothetical protein